MRLHSLNEMARIDDPNKSPRTLGNSEIWIYGSDRSSMTPHFHYFRKGDNKFEVEIRLTDFEICKSKPRRGVKRSNLNTWEKLEDEHKQLLKWLSEPNTDYPERTNKEVLIHTWNQNNRDNQIKNNIIDTMKKDQQKALYESIMKAVAKTVKKALNESENSEINEGWKKWAVGGAIGLAALSALPDPNTQDKSSNPVMQNDSIQDDKDKIEFDQLGKGIQSEWTYKMDSDEMTTQEIQYAFNTSLNTVNFKFPYDGGSKLKLILRDKYAYEQFKNEKSAILHISKGQFNHNVNGNITAKMSFDGKIVQFNCLASDTSDFDILFISNYKKFFNNLKDTKILKIELPFYQEGNKVFTFDVSNLDCEEYVSGLEGDTLLYKSFLPDEKTGVPIKIK